MAQKAVGKWNRLGSVAFAVSMAAVSACSAEDEGDVRYEPSPPAVVERMLELGDAGSADVLYDLGSGDGRIVIAAARDFGVERAIGVEIDPELIERARDNAREAGVSERTRFVRADLFEYDFSDADTVTLFLLPELNVRLRPRLLSELEPGTRVVSHEHRMGDWPPDRSVRVDGHAVHLWIVPAASFGGRWTWTADGERYVLTLRQRYQRITGTLAVGGGQAVLEPASVRGRSLSFTADPADEAGPVFRFRGRLADGRLQGTLQHGEQSLPVDASRAE